MSDEKTLYVRDPKLKLGETVTIEGEEYIVVEDLRTVRPTHTGNRAFRRAASRGLKKMLKEKQ